MPFGIEPPKIFEITKRGVEKTQLSYILQGIIHFPAGTYLLKVNSRNTRTRCEVCSKLTIKTPERRHWHHSGVFKIFHTLL